ncbi:MAG TPA: sugar ABC transporter permease, partial [Firmicutes bacterium]|nr:sugar ABC transporter permease [Bacillota bacterium]
MSDRKRLLTPYLFVLPNVLIFLIFVVFPAIYGLVLSFTKWDVISDPVFVGLKNYISIFSSESFWDTTRKTFIYVFAVVPWTFV